MTAPSAAATSPPLAAALDMPLPQAFDARVRATPEADAYLQHDVVAGDWRSWSWAAIGQEMTCWRRALTAEGIPPGERVALMLNNCVPGIRPELPLAYATSEPTYGRIAGTGANWCSRPETVPHERGAKAATWRFLSDAFLPPRQDT